MTSAKNLFVVAFVCMTLVSSNALAQSKTRQKPGIVGQQAPQWKTSTWHQLPDGKTSLNIDDYKGKVLYLYFFQSWCPGCHRSGFPTLQKVSKAFQGNDKAAFVAIQTTFEGHSTNTPDKLKTIAKRYQLTIPFGQSAEVSGTPEIMRNYRTGGTPWVVIINQQGRVIFNDFHVAPDQAIAGIQQLLAGGS